MLRNIHTSPSVLLCWMLHFYSQFDLVYDSHMIVAFNALLVGIKINHKGLSISPVLLNLF